MKSKEMIVYILDETFVLTHDFKNVSLGFIRFLRTETSLLNWLLFSLT